MWMQKKHMVFGILLISVLLTIGCLDQDNNFWNNNGGSNTVTLIHATQMFDFSTGQYVSESFTTEDIDVILITDGKARLYAHNDAEIKQQGDSEYSSYIDFPVGATCILKDNEGGIATFTVDSIMETTEGYPSVTITWSYSS